MQKYIYMYPASEGGGLVHFNNLILIEFWELTLKLTLT
jgi:hypothetical protein